MMKVIKKENYDTEYLFCTGRYSSDVLGEQWVKCTYIKCYDRPMNGGPTKTAVVKK